MLDSKLKHTLNFIFIIMTFSNYGKCQQTLIEENDEVEIENTLLDDSLTNAPKMIYREGFGNHGTSFSERIIIFDTLNYCQTWNYRNKKCGIFKFMGDKLLLLEDSSILKVQTKKIDDDYINPNGEIRFTAFVENENDWFGESMVGNVILRDKYGNLLYKDELNIINEELIIPELTILEAASLEFVYSKYREEEFNKMIFTGREFKIFKHLLLCHKSKTSKKMSNNRINHYHWGEGPNLGKTITIPQEGFNVVLSLGVKPKFVSYKLEALTLFERYLLETKMKF